MQNDDNLLSALNFRGVYNTSSNDFGKCKRFEKKKEGRNVEKGSRVG
jgi:hypothetical protein